MTQEVRTPEQIEAYAQQLLECEIAKNYSQAIEKAQDEAKRQADNYYNKPREWNKETRREYLNRDNF